MASPRSLAPLLPAALLALGLGTACTSPDAVPQLELVVLSWNIHHGEGTDGVFDLERFAARIRAEQPDFVGLQEVDRGTGRAGGVDQMAELARLTGMEGGFVEAMPYDGGGYGEGWLSRWPVVDARGLDLPVQEGREPRAVAAVTIDHPAGPVTFFATHLDHVADPGLREQQCAALGELYGDVLLGDLNATPDSAAIAGLAPRWRLKVPAVCGEPQMTFPSHAPEKRIDYILPAIGGSWVLIELRTLDEPIASDHLPLRAVLRHVAD